MAFYFSTVVNQPFDKTIELVTKALKAEGFGVVTEIEMTATMKRKLDVDFRNYRILGTCNPSFALKALEAEDKIGTMLPCNVIVQERGENEIEVAAVDPVSSMEVVKNDALKPITIEIRNRLQRVVKSLS